MGSLVFTFSEGSGSVLLVVVEHFAGIEAPMTSTGELRLQLLRIAAPLPAHLGLELQQLLHKHKRIIIITIIIIYTLPFKSLGSLRNDFFFKEKHFFSMKITLN